MAERSNVRRVEKGVPACRLKIASCKLGFRIKVVQETLNLLEVVQYHQPQPFQTGLSYSWLSYTGLKILRQWIVPTRAHQRKWYKQFRSRREMHGAETICASLQTGRNENHVIIIALEQRLRFERRCG